MALFEVDPNTVQPGWAPLLITVLLGIAVLALFFSMRRQFRKIQLPYADEVEAGGADSEAAPKPSN